MNAMILAAGLGTRLQPYSLLRPKPLFPVLDRQLLLLTIARLRQAGAGAIVINTHHLGKQIHSLLAGERGIILQPEEEILGTGGGLRRALKHFDKQPVLVANSDIYHNIDLAEAYRCHLLSGCAATMVVHDCPRFNDVAVAAASRIIGFGGSADPAEKHGDRLAFTGIHVINPEILQQILPDRFSCILDCYRALLKQGGAINAHVVDRRFWTDIGSPDDYLGLHQGLLTGHAPACPELAPAVAAGPFFVAAGALIGRGVKYHDWVSIGAGAVVGDGASLSRVVVWDGAKIAPGARINDTIVT